MDTLIETWNRANRIVADYPLISFLATALLSSLSLLFRRVRETAKRLIGVAWGGLKERLHRLLVKSRIALGIARQDDLDPLREELDEKLPQASRPAGSSSAQTPAPRTIQRFGVKIRLVDEDVRQYLGRVDPHHIGFSRIDRLLQGPFCQKCSHLLTEWNLKLGDYYVSKACPKCHHRWFTADESMTLKKFKELAYLALDAELQQTGMLKDSD